MFELTNLNLKTICFSNLDENEFLPFHGGKRQAMATGGQSMAQADHSWQKVVYCRLAYRMTISGRQIVSEKLRAQNGR